MREVLPLLRGGRRVTAPGPRAVRDEIGPPDGRIFARYVARLDEVEDGLHGTLVVLSDVTAGARPSA